MAVYRLLLIAAAIVFAEGKQGKCNKKIDLAIILDASASIGEENFNMAKDFAKKLCRRFAISKDKAHVSVISYSQHVTLMPKFSDDYNESSIETILDRHIYEGSSTSTGRALKVLNLNVLNKMKSGARTKESDVKRVAVVVTDGYSTTGTEFVKDKANVMKNLGIETFAIGITHRINKEELTVLSSNPMKHHFFWLTDAKVINDIVDSIVKQACR